MLPSRTRLQSWNPESLLSAASTIDAAGDTIYQSVSRLDDRIDAMPESRTWKGAAHDAATEMFRRATKRSSSFKTYAEAFADALRSGSSAIGKARTELLARADDIDAGPLRVTDQWVVMIDPAEMSEEEAAQLQKQASEMQTEINELLLAVGEADDWTALQLIAAGAGKGAAFANLAYSAPSIVEPAPRDEVPDPSTEDGKLFQEIARAQDMATTIREVSETTDRYGNAVTTFHMVDGSEHIRTDWIDQGLPSQQIHPAGTIQILHVDKNKNWISDTTSMPREDGGNLTTVSWADGTTIAISQNPDGTRTGSCTTKTDYAILPDSFFHDSVPNLASAALSGLEVQAGKGINGLSAPALDGLKAGAKFGGPAMGVAHTVFSTFSADTVYERCVALWSGGVSTVGGVATTIAVGAIPGVGPIAAMGANTVGGFAFGYVGKLVGNVMCGP